MISFKDSEYQRAKFIRRGQVFMEPAVQELAEWISNTKNVKVLHIILDAVGPERRPRMQVIFEFFSDAFKFRDNSVTGCNEAEISSIIIKFCEIVEARNLINLNLNGLFVVFSDFESVAKSEAFSKIPKMEFDRLKYKFDSSSVWKVPFELGYPAVFFFKNSQVESKALAELRKYCIEEYYSLIKKFDEFNYFYKSTFKVSFDSKENLDNRYGGNWFYYWHG